MGLMTVFWIVVVIALCLLPFILMYGRRRWLSGQGGLFDCAHRMKAVEGAAGWALGFGRYRGDRLDWYRAFSLSMRPTRSFPRRSTAWLDRRPATALEAMVLFDGSWIVRVRDRATSHEHHLAMDTENALALMTWLESAPPGTHFVPGGADSLS